MEYTLLMLALVAGLVFVVRVKSSSKTADAPRFKSHPTKRHAGGMRRRPH